MMNSVLQVTPIVAFVQLDHVIDHIGNDIGNVNEDIIITTPVIDQMYSCGVMPPPENAIITGNTRSQNTEGLGAKTIQTLNIQTDAEISDNVVSNDVENDEN